MTSGDKARSEMELLSFGTTLVSRLYERVGHEREKED
jgi:hypothetical protein